jgi:hypothetical protein
MNPVQSAPGAQYTPFAAAPQLGPLVSLPPGAGGTLTAGPADGVAGGNMPFGGAIGNPTADDWSNATDPNASVAGISQPSGFFAVLQNLMDQLDTMIGQLLGTPATSISGTAGPVPGDGTVASPPDGAPVPAPANRRPL